MSRDPEKCERLDSIFIFVVLLGVGACLDPFSLGNQMTYSSDQTNGEIAYFSRREIFSIKAALGYGPYAESEPLQKLHSGWEVDISMQAKYLLDDLDSLSESATAAASDAQIVAIEDLRLDYTKQTAVLQSRGKDLRGQLSLLLSIPMAAQKSKQRFLIHYQ